MSGAVKLRECPFCRSEATAMDFPGTKLKPAVTCGRCGADLTAKTLVEAITLWNTRAPDPAVAVLEAEVARLRAQCEDEHQARLSLQNLAADEIDVSIALLSLLSEVRFYVTDALEAYEHTDGRDLLNRIDAALNPAPSEKEAG